MPTSFAISEEPPGEPLEEQAAVEGVLYHRRGGEGVLTLHGEVDIFEAQAVHAAALSALSDSDAAEVTVDLTDVRRMDISAIQILAALRRDLKTAGRTAALQIPEPLLAALKRTGCCL